MIERPEFVWLIERLVTPPQYARSRSKRVAAVLMGEEQPGPWTTDANDAEWFEKREDAVGVAAEVARITGFQVEAREHGFVPGG